MRKLALLALFAVFTVSGFAQQAVGTQEQINRFFKTKTYVVLENNPMLMYNQIIKETVKKHWKLTDYEFVTYSSEEYEKVRKDPTKSFLMMNEFHYTKDKTKVIYDYLCVQLGGDYNLVRDMPDIATVPVAYDGVDEEFYGYKLGMLCRFLQNHIELTRSNPQLNKKNIIKYYYKNLTSDIKNKVLYVTKTDLSNQVSSLAQIKSIYPYKVKIVSSKEIQDAIDRADKDVVFVHKVGPEGSKRKARCYNTIVGAADAKLYYFSWHMISDKKPEGLLKKDFKKLAKAK